mgnify:CR=1 FL=1
MDALDPEQQHQAYMDRFRENVCKGAHKMARVRYTQFDRAFPLRALDFKVYIQIWDDSDWIYNEFLEYCKKLTAEQVELNNSSYQNMADQLFNLIATEMPGRDIWICINHDDVGITIKYNH